MNILVLNWRDMKHPESGGAEVHFQELFSRFVTNGHTVILLATRFPGCAERDVQDGITVYRWGHTYTFNWEAPFLIRRICKEHAVDCIIDDVNKIPFFSPKWFPKIPCGVIFHHLFGKTVFGLAPFPFACYVLMLERLSAWGYKSTPCCTVSPSTAQELVELGFSQKSICIIENSVDTNLYTPNAQVTKENDLLLYAGRLKKYKNVSLVLDGIKLLKDKGKQIRFVIAGSGDDEAALKTQVTKLGIESQVTFAGFVDEKTKINLYRRSSAFVNPSRKEDWGITSIEAGACGTAVIANDVPGLRDSVRHNETGLLYKENDVADFVRCVESVLTNAGSRKTFENGGRQWSLKFSWDESYKRMEQWILSVKKNFNA